MIFVWKHSERFTGHMPLLSSTDAQVQPLLTEMILVYLAKLISLCGLFVQPSVFPVWVLKASQGWECWLNCAIRVGINCPITAESCRGLSNPVKTDKPRLKDTHPYKQRQQQQQTEFGKMNNWNPVHCMMDSTDSLVNISRNVLSICIFDFKNIISKHQKSKYSPGESYISA